MKFKKATKYKTGINNAVDKVIQMDLTDCEVCSATAIFFLIDEY